MARYIRTVSATGVSAPDPLTGDGALICGAYSWEPISVCCNWTETLSNGCINLTGNFGEYQSILFEINGFTHDCCCYTGTCGTICFSSPNCSAYCMASSCCQACCSFIRTPVAHHQTCATFHCLRCVCHVETPLQVSCNSDASIHIKFDRASGQNVGVTECYGIMALSTVSPVVNCTNNQASQYLFTPWNQPSCFNYYWPSKDGAPEGNEWNGIHFTFSRSNMCPSFSGSRFGIWGQRFSKYPTANITG